MRQTRIEEREESLAVHGQPYENLQGRTTANNLREYTCFTDRNAETDSAGMGEQKC